jgi:hypothetical protein
MCGSRAVVGEHIGASALTEQNPFESLAMRVWPIGHHYPRNPQSGSFKLIKIRVGCRMIQRSTHSDDLALVVKGMGQDM